MKKKYIIFVIAAVILICINTSSNIVNIVIYSCSVICLAFLLGKLTSGMSLYIGEKKGGLLAATIGNIPELMMGIWSIRYGMIPMVKASLMGSIMSNMLLGLGIAIFCGGLKYKEQKFNKIIARTNFNMLLLAMSAIIVMAALNECSAESLKNSILVSISIKVSIVLMCIYILGFIFSFCTHRNLFLISDIEENKEKNNKIEGIISIIFLIIVSVMLYFTSDKLIFNIKCLVKNYNISQQFIGIILIPLLGNIGENVSAIMCAMDNKINMSLETAIGSSIQISLFVTPLLMILSCIVGMPMVLVFSVFQIIISVLAVGMSFLVFQDGKSYWFEGAILVSIYIIITIAYYYVC
ncbi:calcium/proton exchanger [Haloimpatiens sp. FM7330]|uniref:calcium/proton exchanger n=1 Tax=Haloimpatiens sp. FM7330 TaxID=3298610 RepID=UPI00363B5058